MVELHGCHVFQTVKLRKTRGSFAWRARLRVDWSLQLITLCDDSCDKITHSLFWAGLEGFVLVYKVTLSGHNIFVSSELLQMASFTVKIAFLGPELCHNTMGYH